MKKPTLKQYTLRNIPQEVDRILRKKSQETGKSFNQVAIEALAEGTQVRVRARRDLSDIAGTLLPDEAQELEAEIKRQHQIDEELWK
jgi:hypothetical protein